MVDAVFHDAVLVPTDGSAAAERAAHQAVGIAEQHDATVHALYAMDMGDVDFVATPDDIAETRSRLAEKGEEFTGEVNRLAAAEGVPCETAVTPGKPEDVITDYVEAEDIDLVVMGRRGQSDPDKAVIGNVAERVLGAVTVPVRTV